jgi:hypothetical protein
MKTILKYLTLSSVALLLISCGGGDTTEGALGDAQTIQVINCDNSNSGTGVNDCGNGATPNYYTCIKAGDTLVALSNDTKLEIVDASNGNKKVCVSVTTPMGNAHIQR